MNGWRTTNNERRMTISNVCSFYQTFINILEFVYTKYETIEHCKNVIYLNIDLMYTVQHIPSKLHRLNTRYTFQLFSTLISLDYEQWRLNHLTYAWIIVILEWYENVQNQSLSSVSRSLLFSIKKKSRIFLGSKRKFIFSNSAQKMTTETKKNVFNLFVIHK